MMLAPQKIEDLFRNQIHVTELTETQIILTCYHHRRLLTQTTDVVTDIVYQVKEKEINSKAPQPINGNQLCLEKLKLTHNTHTGSYIQCTLC